VLIDRWPTRPSLIEPCDQAVLIEETVRGVLIAHLGVDPERLCGDARLDEDLGLDSLGLTEALLVLEDELAVSIPDPVQVELRTLDDLVAVVASQVPPGGGRTGTVNPEAG